ncbi:MAG: ATP-binding protein, partial [Pirellulales bacterium]
TLAAIAKPARKNKPRHAPEWQRDKVEHEIGERQHMEDELRRKEALTRAVLDYAGDGIVTIDERGVVLSFNAAAERMFKRSAKDMIGRNISVLMPAPHDGKHDEYLAHYLETGIAKVIGAPREIHAVDAQGAEFPAEIVITEVLIADVRMFVGVIRDLSERKRMEVDLLHAQKMESVGHLAAGIAHEINTPTQFVGDNLRFLQDAFADLAGLVGESQGLVAAVRGGLDGVTAADEYAAQIEQRDFEYLREEIPKAIEQGLDGLQRVASIVNAMKEFSHPSGEGKQPVDINRVVENATIVSRNEWKYAAELVTDFDPVNPVLYGYEGELGQVLLNLTVNAAHAIAEKNEADPSARGTITIRTRLEGDSVRVSVEDTGGGIPPDIHARVFDPFFTTKAVGKGTGQGLAIAHDVVVRKHGGAISLDTEVGRGTTFHLILPVADALWHEGDDANESESDIPAIEEARGIAATEEARR